jgi:hypothetical protein
MSSRPIPWGTIAVCLISLWLFWSVLQWLG